MWIVKKNPREPPETASWANCLVREVRKSLQKYCRIVIYALEEIAVKFRE